MLSSLSVKPFQKMSPRLSAGIVHAFITFVIFSPYFLFGHLPLWSSDNLYGSLPFFPYGLESISQGWSGWLPYSASGSDFTGSVNNFTYSPFFIPAVFFGEEGIWHYIAFLEIVSFWAVGFLFFLICKEVIKNTGWALFASLCFQLSLVTLYTLQTFPNTVIYACFLLACNAMWRLEEWSPKISICVLIFSFYSMLTTGHYVYAFYWGVLLAVLFIYRHGFHPLDLFKRFSPTQLFVLSAVIAIALSSVRMLPILEILGETNRTFGSVLYSHFMRFFVGVFFFIPEAFGTVLYDTLQLSARTSGYFGGTFQHGSNQHMFFHFTGILTAFLVVIGFFSRHIRGALLWKWLTFLLLAFDLWVLPFSLLFNLFFHPYQHVSMLFGISFPLAVLAGYVGKKLTEGFSKTHEERALLKTEKSELSPLFKSSVTICSLAVYFITAYGLVVYQADWDINMVTILCAKVFLFTPLFLAFLIYNYRNHPTLGPFYIRLALFLFSAAVFLLLSFGATISYLGQTGLQELLGLPVNPNGNSEIYTRATIWDWASIASVIIVGGWVFLRPETLTIKKLACLIALFGILICIPWIATPDTGIYQAALPFPSMVESEILVVTGGVRLALVFSVLMLIFYSMEKGKLKAASFPIISCALLIIIMVPIFKEFSYFVTRPFLNVEDGRLFPLRTEYDDLDLKNYRVNFLHQLVSPSEIYQPALGQEEITNLHVIYRLPTYGGINGTFSRLDMEFLNEVGGARPDFGQPSNITNPRFLDLSGVRYDFSQEDMIERPGALSRFMFFSDYEVVGGKEKMLKRLKEPNFDPSRKILIDRDVGLTDTRAVPARKIDYTSTTHDDLSLTLESEEGGVLLFNDTYSPGWEVWIDGVQSQIIHANHKFMGTYIPRGQHEINFIYRPLSKRVGLFIAGLGLIALLGFLLWPSSAGLRSPGFGRQR